LIRDNPVYLGFEICAQLIAQAIRRTPQLPPDKALSEAQNFQRQFTDRAALKALPALVPYTCDVLPGSATTAS
jgi:hypothetical protein